MARILTLMGAAAIAVAPIPVSAQAVNFTLVNNTDLPFSQLQVRRFGSDQWLPLTVSPLPVTAKGGEGAVDFKDEDCAFDLQARLPDGRFVIWSGVNLCDARVVTLNRNARGLLWVDYR